MGDASRIDIVRGPPSPIYGPGFVGGLLNFIPKSASDSRAYLARPTGELDYTGGSYGKNNVTAQFGFPVNLGAVNGGVYGYGEFEDSHSFYWGIHPQHQMGEISARFDLPDDWKFAADFSYYHSTGDVQTPGWNRVTQNLIDNQTYITGRNTALTQHAGRPYLTPPSLADRALLSIRFQRLRRRWHGLRLFRLLWRTAAFAVPAQLRRRHGPAQSS